MSGERVYLRPMVPGAPHPDEVIPGDVRADFIRHFTLTWRTRTTDDYDRAEKGIPEIVLKKIAKTWEEIRSLGWRPVGISSNNEIEWGYVQVWDLMS